MRVVWNKPKKENRLSVEQMSRFRNFIFQKSMDTCQICHKEHIAEFHHLMFGSYGADKDDRTLIGVCRKCHEWCHAHKHESQKAYKQIANENWSEYGYQA